MELMHPGDEEVPEVHRRTTFDHVSCDVQRGAYLVHEDRRPALRERALVGSVMAALVQGAAALEHVLDIINVRHTGKERAVTRELPAAGADWLRLPIVESRAGFSLGTFLGEVTRAEADVALDLLVAMADAIHMPEEAAGPPPAEVHLTDAITQTHKDGVALEAHAKPTLGTCLPKRPADPSLTLAVEIKSEQEAVDPSRAVGAGRVALQPGVEEILPGVVPGTLE
jgi:hypothetical protein